VDLVVHEVVELEHVHDAHRDVLLERFSGTTVEEDGLAGRVAPGLAERPLDVVLARTVEDGRAEEDPLRQLAGELEDLLVTDARDELREGLVGGAVTVVPSNLVDLAQLLPNGGGAVAPLVQLADLVAQAARAPPEVWSPGSARRSSRLGTPSGFRTRSTGVPSPGRACPPRGGCG
jgi:hypothetical protein